MQQGLRIEGADDPTLQHVAVRYLDLVSERLGSDARSVRLNPHRPQRHSLLLKYGYVPPSGDLVAFQQSPSSLLKCDKFMPHPDCSSQHKRGHMSTVSAAESGTFLIGGQTPVARLGFGAMRIAGPGVWGEPTHPAEARRVLARLPKLGVTFIDTADSYGPSVSERLIREVLFPYEGMVIATKAGLTRPAPGQWLSKGNPDYLIAQAKKSRDALGVDRIDLWQLHRIDPEVRRDEQFAAVRELQTSGVIKHAGLSEVSVDEIKAAQKYFRVATVQNRYNLADRGSEDVLDYCESNDIGFIPWFPLAAGDLARTGGSLDRIAHSHGGTVSQIALSWILKRSPVTLPIPGTSNVSHLEENVAACGIALSDDEFSQLTAIASLPSSIARSVS